MPLLLRLLACWLVSGVLAPTAHAENAARGPIEQQRSQFLQTERELRSGPGKRYRALRKPLDEYPLAIYLDYRELRDRLRKATPEQANAWLARAAGSPLENRLREAWILDHGQRQRWRALLAVQPDPPNQTKLQCYYWRAKFATGDRSAAFEAAAALWNVGESQDRACDPLFAEWFTAAGPDDALIWSRALKAFEARSPQLLAYLTRFASADLLPLMQELYAIYRRPETLLTDDHTSDPRHAELLTVGIRRLARVNPEKGLAALERSATRQKFLPEQKKAMNAMIARHSLFTKSAAPEDWLHKTLAQLGDDELTAIYLRRLLRDSDWSGLLLALSWLSQAEAERDVWRWWHGRALEATGDRAAAETIWRELAAERSFHGFMAADRLGISHALNNIAPETDVAGVADPGLARVTELMALGRVDQARAEWHLLLQRVSPEEQLWLADYAQLADWSVLAISATNAAGAWDVLDLRFPWLYRDIFAGVGREVGLAPGELVAIARRESALYPRAVSPVGARGLMQLMPGTARQEARRLGVPYRRQDLFQPRYNIDLGARYYAGLRQRYDGLRPLALAAYNAGPHRVDRWLEGSLAVDQWIDSLPFRETREYVRAVLSYVLIYQLRDGESVSLLSADELKRRY